MIRTRLDTVVRLRERDEEERAQNLAKAEVEAREAAQRATQARQNTLRDERNRGDASRWAMAEVAHQRALLESKRADHDAARLRQDADGARVNYTAAHQQAEVVRRVADHRRSEIAQEQNRAEDRALDDVATLLFTRKTG